MRVVPAFWGCNPAPIFPHYRMGLIICGFPGIGKTELADQPLLVPHYRITELDSSEFLSRHVNAGTVAAYCTALINACEPNTIVLASTHHEVLQELWDRRSHLVFIYPLESEKDEWIARLQSRQASADLVNLVRNNWDALMYDFERYTHLAYTLRSDQDLREEIKRIVTDILNRLEVMARSGGTVALNLPSDNWEQAAELACNNSRVFTVNTLGFGSLLLTTFITQYG
ncbi:hypothetical protein H634G_08116 [Metarhizium anisopliae BRIP 53293]|uniref:Uncharacterized protein n=1 Tax=Metarhizium anisopliae BRIP 53293 TaxID=1291518 RepID=A0A0D9NS17_METAN|nr:hypothetical protein H634G_08116 [Metarhizium anisopliae BRIP 53293]KJK85460.1 hypothetical protein H633G_10697 [Metarhizium anisopliae BRIP 53284]